MDIGGQIRTTCPRAFLVKVMRDPACLATLLPQGSVMTLGADGTYVFSVSKTFGPVKLTMPGTMTLDPQPDGMILTAKATHMIGGKVDLTVALQFGQHGDKTELAYTGSLTASGLAGRVLKDHHTRVNDTMKRAMQRLRLHAEIQHEREQGATA